MAIRFREARAGEDFTASPLEGLEQGIAVDRFTGAAIDFARDDAGRVADFNAIFNTTVTEVPSIIEVTTNRNITATQNRCYVIEGVDIVYTGDSSIRTNTDGVHIMFVNCRETISGKTNNGANAFSGSQAAGINTNTTATGREDVTYAPENGGAIGDSSSINRYGCDSQLSPLATSSNAFVGDTNTIQIAGDVIGSDIFMGGTNNWTPSIKEGSRFINSYFENVVGPNVFVFYGTPSVDRGNTYIGFGFVLGQGATHAGPYLQADPNIDEFEVLYSVQAGTRTGLTAGSNVAQVIGFTCPPGNDDGSNIPTEAISARGNSYVSIQNGGGGCFLYYGFRPSFFDGVGDDRSGIQNVRTRLFSTFAQNAGQGAANNFQDIPLTTTANRVALAQEYIQEAMTNANGLLVSNRYSRNAGVLFEDGYYDYLGFNEQTATGSATFGQTFGFVRTAPPNTVFAPMFDLRGAGAAALTASNYVRHALTFDVRSYSHNIQRHTAVAGNALTAGTHYPVEAEIIVGGVNALVKPQNVHTTGANINQPNITFNAGDSVSLNDIRDAYRAAWYDFDFNITPVLQDPRTDAISITINNDLTSDYVASDESIQVRAAAIARDADNDRFLTDLNINTLNLNSGRISDHQIAVSGNIVSCDGMINMIVSCDGEIQVTSTAVVDATTLQNSPTVVFDADADLTTGLRDTSGRLLSGWDLNLPDTAATTTNPIFFPQSDGATTRVLTLTVIQALTYFGVSMGADQTDDTFSSRNIQLRTLANPENTFTLNVPAEFRGRLALAHRVGGRGGSGAFTPISVHNFTTTPHPTVTITDADPTYGRGGTNTPVVITCGAEYRLQVQDITFPTTVFGVSGTFEVTPLPDQNYTAGIRGADITASSSGDLLVDEDSTAAGEIILNISGAETGYDISQTTKLIAEGRNDEDYIDEVMDGGRILDFINISGNGTIELQGDVTFRRLTTGPNAATTQQFLEGIDFDSTTTTFVSTTAGCRDVIIFPARTGITPTQVREAVAPDFNGITTAIGAHDDAITGETVHARINLVSANVNQVDRVADNIDSNLVQVNDNVIIASVKPAAVQTAQRPGNDDGEIETTPPL